MERWAGVVRNVTDRLEQTFHDTMIVPFCLAWLNNCRRYCFYVYRTYKPEVLTLTFLLAAGIILYLYTHSWWRTVYRWRSNAWSYLAWGESGPDADSGLVASQQRKASWDIKKSNVAVYAIQGRRQHMEDRFNVVNNFEDLGTSIYGIFDGHGGEFAADFVEKTLFRSIMVRLLKAEVESLQENYTNMLTEEILSVDKQLLGVAQSTHIVAGTTALLALLKNNELTVANVGDSRGVICDKNGKAIPLSFDHKPNQVKERKRIRKAGGFVSFNGVWRVAGVLATSRALGDYPLKVRNLVIAEPDILTFDIDDLKPKFMILATDGLWDTFTNDEAVQYIKERLDEPHYGAKSITLQAYYKGSLDNITVMVVKFIDRTTKKWKKHSKKQVNKEKDVRDNEDSVKKAPSEITARPNVLNLEESVEQSESDDEEFQDVQNEVDVGDEISVVHFTEDTAQTNGSLSQS